MGSGRARRRWRPTAQAPPAELAPGRGEGLVCGPETLCCIGLHSLYTNICKYISVLLMLDACFARLAQQTHVYGNVSFEHLHA